MQNNSLLGQRGVLITPARKHRYSVSGVWSVARPVAGSARLPGTFPSSPAIPAASPPSYLPHKPPATAHWHTTRLTCSHSVADPSPLKCLTQQLRWTLPQILAALCCMPLLQHLSAQASQRWCLLSLAGVLLPLQTHHAHHSLKRFQHVLQAAAAVEAETETPEPQGEEPNDNTVVETGAELGNVQTPASVWLPYSTGSPGKVCVHMLRVGKTSHAHCMHSHV